MTNEAREQIAKLICNLANDAGECESCKKHKGCPDSWDDVREKVDSVIAKFEELGYRPRPKLTLITDEEIDDALTQNEKRWNDVVDEAFSKTPIDFDKLRKEQCSWSSAIARAQLDHNLREG